MMEVGQSGDGFLKKLEESLNRSRLRLFNVVTFYVQTNCQVPVVCDLLSFDITLQLPKRLGVAQVSI